MTIKNKTYRNLMAIIRRIEKKGYDFRTSEILARNIFEEFTACPQGKSIEARVEMILPKDEFEQADKPEREKYG